MPRPGNEEGSLEDALRSVAFPLARFSAFASNALLFGLVPVLVLVLRPGFAALPGDEWNRGRRRIEVRLEGFVQAALWAAATATLVAIALQAVLISEFSSEGDVSQESLFSVFETTFGQWYGARLPLLVALAVLLGGRLRAWALAGAGDDRPSPGAPWWAAWAVLSVALLSTSSFSGHAAVATPRGLSILNDITHLVAGATWFTGVVVLAVVLPDGWRGGDPAHRIDLMRATIVRFSNLALGSIGLVLLTGIVNSLLHVGALGDLFGTSYGLALVGKVALFGGILALGAVNHLVVRRRLERGGEDESATPALFRRVIAAELILALAIMGATGFLTGQSRTRQDATSPARDERGTVTTSVPSP